MTGADFDQDEIRVAGPTADSFLVESGFELRARGHHFAGVPVEIGNVSESGHEAGQSQRIHAVGREHAPHPAQQFHGAGEQSDAQAGKTVSF